MSEPIDTGSRANLRTRRPASVSGKLALACAVFVATFLLAEGGHRLWLAWRGDPYDPWQTVADLRRKSNLAASLLDPVVRPDSPRIDTGSLGVLHPYFGSEKQPDAGGVLEHFRRGVPAEEYTVVVVGGSVATAFAINAGELLASLLEADPRLSGRNVVTLNYSQPALKQPQQLTSVAWLLTLGYRPDAVINLDGFNEVAMALENAEQGTHPAYPSFFRWGALIQDYASLDAEGYELVVEFWRVRESAQDLLDRTLAWRLYHSSLLGRAALRRLDELNRRHADLQARLVDRQLRAQASEPSMRQLHGPPFAGSGDELLGQCVSAWSGCSRGLDALCERMGIGYLHVLQPTLGDVGSKLLTEREKSYAFPTPAWRRGAQEGYPLLREAGRKLSEDGVAFLDASGAFAGIDEEIYRDACHINPRGNEILCGLMARAFREEVLGH